MREALYGLDLVASELDPAYPRRALADAMESAMLADPTFWRAYYTGVEPRPARHRHYSYSDRIRYYWPSKPAAAAVERLLATLAGTVIPPPLISQFLPRLASDDGEPAKATTAPALVTSAIDRVLAQYAAAAAGRRWT